MQQKSSVKSSSHSSITPKSPLSVFKTFHFTSYDNPHLDPAEIEKMKAEAKADYERSIADLEKRNAALQIKVKEYKNEGNTQWESFKREYNYDMEELGKAMKNLTKNNKK